MKKGIYILMMLAVSMGGTSIAQTVTDTTSLQVIPTNNELQQSSIQVNPVVATESNNIADSGIVMNEESVDAYYGMSGSKVITTNIISRQMVAYPNPAVDYVNVILPDIATRTIHAYLHDLQGAVIYSYVFAPGGNQIAFDLTSLPQGMYNLRIYEEGYDMQFIRIVKDR